MNIDDATIKDWQTVVEPRIDWETPETRKGYDWTQAKGPVGQQRHRGVHYEGELHAGCPACDEIAGELCR